jgi:gas vesicle protein
MYDDYRRGGGVGSVFFAFILGGLVGGVLGILFAPRPGKETRDMLAEKGQEYLDEGKEMYETGKERATEMYETGVKSAGEMYDTGVKAATEKSEELRSKIDETRAKLQEQVGAAAGTVKEKVEAARTAKPAEEPAVAVSDKIDPEKPAKPNLDEGNTGGVTL